GAQDRARRRALSALQRRDGARGRHPSDRADLELHEGRARDRGSGRPMTDRYAVIGNPIAHSRSPAIHAHFAEATGQDIVYERLLAPVAGFAQAALRFRDEGGRGLNVTLPFKLDAFALAGLRSARAEAAGAVNLLAFDGDRIYGDNTDGAGLVRDIEVRLALPLAGRAVMLLG